MCVSILESANSVWWTPLLRNIAVDFVGSGEGLHRTCRTCGFVLGRPFQSGVGCCVLLGSGSCGSVLLSIVSAPSPPVGCSGHLCGQFEFY